MPDLPALDPVLHQTVRTRLAVLLALGPRSFSDLKAGLAVTDGNLDAHLRKLARAGYLQSWMVVEGRPRTLYELSDSGKEAFRRYVAAMGQLLERARPS